LSAYPRDGVGLDDANLALLEEIARIVKLLKGPWLIAADWNINPDTLIGSKWPELLGAAVVAPATPTCHSNTYD
jgi:hypothetical protein